MSGSCCGGDSKSKTTSVAVGSTPRTIEAPIEKPSEKSSQSECCKDDSAKVKSTGAAVNLSGRSIL